MTQYIVIKSFGAYPPKPAKQDGKVVKRELKQFMVGELLELSDAKRAQSLTASGLIQVYERVEKTVKTLEDDAGAKKK